MKKRIRNKDWKWYYRVQYWSVLLLLFIMALPKMFKQYKWKLFGKEMRKDFRGSLGFFKKIDDYVSYK